MEKLNSGNYRCYAWNYCPPEHCYIIIAISKDKHNDVVQSEYYILADDEKIDLIQNVNTPFRIPKSIIGSLIKKASDEALTVALAHAESTLFAAHKHGPYCLHKDPAPVYKRSLVQWYHSPNLRKKLLEIENKTFCEPLKEALKGIRELNIT